MEARGRGSAASAPKAEQLFRDKAFPGLGEFRVEGFRGLDLGFRGLGFRL